MPVAGARGMPWPRTGARRPAAGSVLAEVALLLTVLLLLAVGAMDFARVFYVSIELSNAARAGVQYGAQNVGLSGDTAGMIQAAKNDAQDISMNAPTASRFCQCPDGTNVSCTGSCIGGTKRIYVQVNTSATFKTLLSYPGIPSTISLSGQAVMRAQ